MDKNSKMIPSWASAWDGQELVHLRNLAVRAYVATVGHVLYAVDDAPHSEDGVVELWIDQAVPYGFSEAVLSRLESERYIRIGGVNISLDDDLLNIRLRRSFRLSEAELLAMAGQDFEAMAKADLAQMDDVFLNYKKRLPAAL